MPAFPRSWWLPAQKRDAGIPALHEDRHSRRPVPAPERHRTARTFRHGIYRRQGGGSVLLSGRLWRFPFLCTTTHTGTEKDRQKAHGRNIYDRLEQFLRFRGERDLLFEEVDSNLMVEYETFLKGINVCPNSSSFYMRNLRAIYNRAVERELTVQRYPFKHVYTGVDKTVKRAVPLKVIRRIRDLDLTLSPVLDYARDLFMFSFYTRGMAFVDMAYLKRRICRTEFWSIAARRRDSSFLSSGRNPCRRLSASTIRPRLLICCRSSGIWIRMPESNTRTPPILSMTN